MRTQFVRHSSSRQTAERPGPSRSTGSTSGRSKDAAKAERCGSGAPLLRKCLLHSVLEADDFALGRTKLCNCRIQFRAFCLEEPVIRSDDVEELALVTI